MDLLELLKKEDVAILRNLPLSEHTTIHVGGCARTALFPDRNEKLIYAVRALHAAHIPYRVIGRMSNTCPPDGICETVLIFTGQIRDIILEQGRVCVSAGVSLHRLCRTLLENGQLSFPELCGIPGSLGGAVVNNAGAFGTSIAEHVESVQVYDPAADTVRTLSREQLLFSYRNSVIRPSGFILLCAVLTVHDTPDAPARVRECARMRRNTQPLEFPSLGCVFKKVGQLSAGLCIERAGLKGLCIGGAQVSRRHAGFIINRGNATAADVRTLFDTVKTEVARTEGVVLTPEIEFL